jgi:hypothetical protein
MTKAPKQHEEPHRHRDEAVEVGEVSARHRLVQGEPNALGQHQVQAAAAE